MSSRTDADILHVDGSSMKERLIKNGDLRDFRKFHVHLQNNKYLLSFHLVAYVILFLNVIEAFKITKLSTLKHM